jgi:formylglycine-generating enzyme required for sulfatase activity
MPANAANKNVSWDSNKPEIATVENGLITAQSIGRASIKVTTEDGARTAICVVTVFESVEIEMVRVEGGTFLMGCSDDECFSFEIPQHQVTLSSYKIGIYPVTQKQWVSIMGSNPSYYQGENLPVDRVSWDMIQDFIFALNRATGKNYRLPTEAEWEFAARGGNKSEGYKYSGSNNIDEVAWYLDNSNYTTHPVATKKPNELGIYDMSGNVREWCKDGSRTYVETPQTNPQGPVNINTRILRGADAADPMRWNRVSMRFSWSHNSIGEPPTTIFGFRLVLPE